MSDGINQTIAGPAPTIVHGDKTWTISYPTQKAKANLVSIITANAKANVMALRESDPAGFAEYSVELNKAIFGGYFKTWHPGWIEAMSGQDGDTLFLLSLLRIQHPESTMDDAAVLIGEHSAEVAASLAEVMPNFIDLLEKDYPQSVPKAERTERFRAMREKWPTTPTA